MGTDSNTTGSRMSVVNLTVLYIVRGDEPVLWKRVRLKATKGLEGE
jgi:hypothetical protein